MVSAKNRKLFLDFDASRQTAMGDDISRFRFLHFATHAIVDNQHPELSGIVLSMVDKTGRLQNGFLSANEIFDLKLPAELVVLSACRTGLGKEFKGEGLVGLTRAFMYAGAARIVVSIWDVDDKPTSELMVRFYRYMLGPAKLRPAAALRAAQLEMSRDPRWHSPYYWAAFVLQGEWK
jgi:CHAT domain-containing protein